MEEPCVICLELLSCRATTTMTCNHTFHTKCLDTWKRVKEGDLICPLCKHIEYAPLLLVQEHRTYNRIGVYIICASITITFAVSFTVLMSIYINDIIKNENATLS